MENAFFEQINVNDLDLPDVIVLSDGGDWCYLKDYLAQSLTDSCLLRRVNRPQDYQPPRVFPAKKPKTPEVIAEKSPEDALAEYRITARMPGEYGRFLNELAYQRRSNITAELQRLVAAEMEKHPEILASLDELNN
jgi:hypothetical protein